MKILCCLLLVAGCALVEEVKNLDTNVNLFSRDNFEKRLRDRGEVLIERKLEGPKVNHAVMVIQEGKKIIKYELYDVIEGVDGLTNTRTPQVAMVDTVSEKCYVFDKNLPVETECQNFLSDPDMERFIP